MQLYYAKNDIERKFGFTSKKFTMVNYVFTFIIGALMALAAVTPPAVSPLENWF